MRKEKDQKGEEEEQNTDKKKKENYNSLQVLLKTINIIVCKIQVLMLKSGGMFALDVVWCVCDGNSFSDNSVCGIHAYITRLLYRV